MTYPPPPPGPPPAVSKQNNGKAIGSLVCGLIALGLTLFSGGTCLLATWILGLVAVILGFKARKEIKENPYTQTGDGFALGGIITGFIVLVLGILGLLVVILYFVIIVLFLGGSLFF